MQPALDSATIAGTLKIKVSKIGKIDGMTMPHALRVLHEAAKAPVALRVPQTEAALMA